MWNVICTINQVFKPVPSVWNTLSSQYDSIVSCYFLFCLVSCPRFSHVIGFYHHFRCEVTGVRSVISEGGSNARRQLSKEGWGRGGIWPQPSADSSLPFLSFSFCGIVFFTFFKIFFTPPLLLLYSVLCPCLHTKHLHVNMRVCTTRGSDFLSCPICHPH